MSAEEWAAIPDVGDYPAIEHTFAKEGEPFQPYARDPETLARQFAIPGTPGLEHRIGGLEKDARTGGVSYDPENHQRMTETRAEKVARIADAFPPVEVEGDAEGDVLVVGWGSTYGSIKKAVQGAQARGLRVGHTHLRWLNPLPPGLGDALGRFRHVLVPELNGGQLVHVLRDRFLVDAQGLSKVQGLPFSAREVEASIVELAASPTDSD